MADLRTLIPAEVVGILEEELLLLDRFYIQARYPDAVPGSLENGLPGREEAMEAFKLAKKVLEVVSTRL